MEIVQGFVLRMNREDEKFFRSVYEPVLSNSSNKRNNVPIHLTLTIAAFRSQDIIQKAIRSLEMHKKDFFSVPVEILSAEGVGDTYIGLSISSPEVHGLQERLLDSLHPILKGQHRQKYENAELSAHEKVYLREYGYHRVKEFFEPHITIGRYESEVIRDQQLQTVPKNQNTYMFDTLLLDESDYDHGNMVPKIFWETQLS
jgi:hypothetical protein